MGFEKPEVWILILLILVVFFGAKKLPELARSLGRSSTEFKKGLKEGAAEPPQEGSSKKDPEPPEPPAGQS